MNVFSRSWEITKLSIDVIKKDRELLIFPLLAGIFSVLFIIAMVFPALVGKLFSPPQDSVSAIVFYGFIFIIYLGLSFIATFFNVCVVYTTKKRFEGGNATFGESIKFAFSKVNLIFLWSILSATVGLILKILDNAAQKSSKQGRIILSIMNSIFGMIWSVITIFVVPGMVYHNLGPVSAIKKSIGVLKKTWGESLIRHYGLGLVQFLFLAVGGIVALVLGFLASSLSIYAVIIVIILGGLYLLGVVLFFAAANGVFNTALYAYANTGKIPEGYNDEILRNAFVSRK